MTIVRLAAGAWEVTLLPAVGGAIGSLRRAGADILRPCVDPAPGVLGTACFPLVPYANRIAWGRFRFEGQETALPPNFGDHPHTLHGIGWQRAWTVERATGDTAVLRLHHRGDRDWPWAFDAVQAVSIDGGGLSTRLTVTAGAQAMPAGVGFHPYFPAPPGTRLRTAVDGVWLVDDTQLPTRRVAGDRFGDWIAGDRATPPVLVDHCHDGWSGALDILYADRRVTMRTDGARFLHLYMPPAQEFLCVEPVSHAPDAVNHPERGLDILGPGQQRSITMRIAVAG